MALTETRLRALKVKDKPYKVADQRGLYIEVTPSGGKLWRFRYRIGKVEKKLAIGSYPDISLKQAREATYEARHSVASGGDPAFEKRKQKIREEFLSAQTFEAVAREYIDVASVCRMFNEAVACQPRPKHISTDHDPIFRFHR